MSNACNVHVAVRFVSLYEDQAAEVAGQLDLPTENILGLAAHECRHGIGRFAVEGNSFFSMRSPASYEIGTMTAKGDAKVKLAKFASFEMAAKSFKDRWGEGVRGKKDAGEFSRTLVTIGFNTGKSSNGGTDNYAKILENIIRMVKVRMQCR